MLSAEELQQANKSGIGAAAGPDVPFPFATAREMLDMGDASGLSVADMKRANELARSPGLDLDAGLDRIWAAMESCMERGLAAAGTLPGGLKVKRRASEIYAKLRAEHGANSLQPHRIMDWLGVYAMAVNEENAGRRPGRDGADQWRGRRRPGGRPLLPRSLRRARSGKASATSC